MPGTSLAVQWLTLCTPNAGATGLIPGWGTKIPHVARHGQKKKKLPGRGQKWGWGASDTPLLKTLQCLSTACVAGA